MNGTGNHKETLFYAALQLPTFEGRAAYLQEACGGNDQLRQRVEALLQAAHPSNDFLEQPAAGEPPSLPAYAEKPGDRIGRYKLLQQIGEGGMGSVWVAEQTEPVRREVALKIIKLGMDTKQVIARFEAERQALALMDDPNIAKVLDAGATDTGRPFFVMERIKGIPITKYCDDNKLDTQQRLELFIQVCRAIQHAHQKGIIHRDIKPSNILVVAPVPHGDSRPVPKVIDFGIAKAAGGQILTDKSIHTMLAEFIGTPEYMSPEQAELSGLDIDTRSDIYALGVLLYELLTGHMPFEEGKLLRAGLDEMRRMIRENEPPRPSTRLSTLAVADLSIVAKQRRVEPPRLIHLLRRDLDWIVMKCLEKDRSRRYEAATGLADDVERHLKNEPVTAAAPGAMYRARKFVRRHRYGFATAAVIMLLLLAGVVVSTWQMVQSRRAERQTRTVATFLQDMLNCVRPEVTKGADITLLCHLLDNSVARIDRQLQDQPEVQASLRLTIGCAYLNFGQYHKAGSVLSAARRGYEAISASRRLGYTDSTLALARVAVEEGRYAEAEALSREVLRINRKSVGGDATTTVRALNSLAEALRIQGKLSAADLTTRQALETSERMLGKEHPITLASVNDLASVLFLKGDYTGAEALYARGLEASERILGKEHPDTLRSVNNLANLLQAKGDYATAEALFARGLEASERILGKEHPETLARANNLATVLFARGDYVENEALCRQVLAARERILGMEHPDTLLSVNNLAIVLCAKRDYAEAEALCRRGLEVSEHVLGKEHPDTLKSANELANSVLAKGDYAEAKTLYRQVLAARERVLGKGHRDTLITANSLVHLLFDKGDYAEAELILRDKLAELRKLLGDENPIVAQWLANLSLLLWKQDKLAEAEAVGRERVFTELRLANATRAHNLQQVITALTEAIIQKPDDPWRYEARAFLLGRSGQWQRAAKDLAQAVKLDAATPAFALGPLLVETGDTTGYMNFRSRLLTGLSGEHDPETAAETAMGIVLRPAQTGMIIASQLADTAVNGGTNDVRLPYFQLVKALAEYRCERFLAAC
jgi:eukaryotic-like serine/threonine-protein kinase